MASISLLHEIDQLGDDWDKLVETSQSPHLFMTSRWIKTWWRQFGDSADPWIICVRNQDSLIAGVPLMKKDGVISFIGGEDLFDYHDFVIGAGDTGKYYQLFGSFLLEAEWDVLDFTSILESSPTIKHIPDFFKNKGFNVQIVEEDVVPGIILPKTWDGFLQSLRKKDRHELRRKIRRIEESGQYHLRSANLTTLDDDIVALLDLMRTSHIGKQDFLTENRAQFFRTIVKEMAELNYLRLQFLEIEGTPLAVVLGFDYGGIRWLYNSGYMVRADSLSAGLVLKALFINDAVDIGLEYFDFMKGAEAYKYRLGGKDSRLYRIFIDKT